MAKQRIDLIVDFDIASSQEAAMAANTKSKPQDATERLADIAGAALFFGIDPLLNIAMVCSMTSFSRAHIGRHVTAGTFPKPIAISPGRVAWRASDIRNHIEGLFAAAPTAGDVLPRAKNARRGRPASTARARIF